LNPIANRPAPLPHAAGERSGRENKRAADLRSEPPGEAAAFGAAVRQAGAKHGAADRISPPKDSARAEAGDGRAAKPARFDEITVSDAVAGGGEARALMVAAAGALFPAPLLADGVAPARSTALPAVKLDRDGNSDRVPGAPAPAPSSSGAIERPASSAVGLSAALASDRASSASRKPDAPALNASPAGEAVVMADRTGPQTVGEWARSDGGRTEPLRFDRASAAGAQTEPLQTVPSPRTPVLDPPWPTTGADAAPDQPYSVTRRETHFAPVAPTILSTRAASMGRIAEPLAPWAHDPQAFAEPHAMSLMTAEPTAATSAPADRTPPRNSDQPGDRRAAATAHSDPAAPFMFARVETARPDTALKAAIASPVPGLAAAGIPVHPSTAAALTVAPERELPPAISTSARAEAPRPHPPVQAAGFAPEESPAFAHVDAPAVFPKTGADGSPSVERRELRAVPAAAAAPMAEPQRAAILAKPDATAAPAAASLPAAPLAAAAGEQPGPAWRKSGLPPHGRAPADLDRSLDAPRARPEQPSAMAARPIEPESPRRASDSIAALWNGMTTSATPAPVRLARAQAASEIAAPRGEPVASPAQQVVSVLAQAVTQNSTGAGAAPPLATAPPPPAASAAFGGPLRVLRIELRPETLGHVTATIHLRNGSLELRLEASAEAADLLRRDRHTLSDLLAGAGYAVDAQQVEIVEAPPAVVQPAQPQGQPQQHASSQSGFEGRSGGFSQGAGTGDQQPPRSPARNGAEEREANHAPAPADARTGLYL
jgi:hypothetical protein